MKIINRSSTRLKEYDYSQTGMYFITVCIAEKKCCLGQAAGGEIELSFEGNVLQEEILKTPSIRPEIQIDQFVIMPNHFHLILGISDKPRATHRVAPTLAPGSIGAVIGQIKSITSKRITKAGHTFGWQRNYFEHVIRNKDELDSIRRYIMNNPYRWNQDKENLDTKMDDIEYKFWEEFKYDQ